jgi:HSP20 family protein
MAWFPESFGDDVLRYVDRVRRQVDRAFETIPMAGLARQRVYPLVNVTETAEALLVRAELPGVRKEDLEITLSGPVLTIAGSEAEESDYAAMACHRKERGWGAFSRNVQMPDTIDPEAAVQASMRHGVLEIRLPKRAAEQPRKITIS